MADTDRSTTGRSHVRDDGRLSRTRARRCLQIDQRAAPGPVNANVVLQGRPCAVFSALMERVDSPRPGRRAAPAEDGPVSGCAGTRILFDFSRRAD